MVHQNCLLGAKQDFLKKIILGQKETDYKSLVLFQHQSIQVHQWIIDKN